MLVQALGLTFTVSTFALAVSLAGTGDFSTGVAWQSLVALAPAFAGMFAGQKLRSKVQPETFRRIFLTGLLALGAWLALQGLT